MSISAWLILHVTEEWVMSLVYMTDEWVMSDLTEEW